MWGFAVEILKSAVPALVGVPTAVYFVRRTELRNRIDQVAKEVEATRSLACDYWSVDSSGPNNISLETLLKHKLSSLSMTLQSLDSSFRTFRCDADYSSIKFKQAITDGKFESTSRSAENERLENINSLAIELEADIRNSQKWI